MQENTTTSQKVQQLAKHQNQGNLKINGIALKKYCF